ncbi:MAG: DUF1800 family protein [Candidatus Methylacidiphilales bacterium]
MQSHLLRRAGFGALGMKPSSRLDSAKLTLDQCLERLLDVPRKADPSRAPAWVDEPQISLEEARNLRNLSPDHRKEKIDMLRRLNRKNLRDLRTWWLKQMFETEFPLQEKMALFWHGHFVSSSEKVKETRALWKQNELFRYSGTGSFEDLTVQVGRDPAMLEFLDGARSKKQAPNENYARELMELFLLGEGHYTEEDVKEAARAFTGWTVRRFRAESMFNSNSFDTGTKTILGKTGPFNDADVVRVLLATERSPRYLCTKLWSYFAYSQPEPEIIDSLTTTFRESTFQIQPVLREMFASEAFYSKKALRTQIKSPINWLASMARILSANSFPYEMGISMASQLGQELFNPPSVKGWDEGRAWISTSTLILRNNLAHLLLNGGNPQSMGLQNRRVENLPAAVVEAMTPEQKKRIQRAQETGKRLNLPSQFSNPTLMDEWKSARPDERLSVLARWVHQGPMKESSVEELGRHPDLAAASDPSESALKKALFALVSHPEFQLG